MERQLIGDEDLRRRLVIGFPGGPGGGFGSAGRPSRGNHAMRDVEHIGCALGQQGVVEALVNGRHLFSCL